MTKLAWQLPTWADVGAFFSSYWWVIILFILFVIWVIKTS